MNAHKTKRKWIFIIVGIILVVLLFFVIAKFIIVDDCVPVSFCSKSGSRYCLDGCEEITLLDVILGQDK